jgi:preprotein translocase subunit SecG
MRNFPIHMTLQVIQLVSSVLLVLAVLLQTPKSSSGLGGTIGGGGDSGGGYRTRRGLENTLFQITIGLTVIFVIVSVVNIKLG